eukprot:s1887_g5.t1
MEIFDAPVARSMLEAFLEEAFFNLSHVDTDSDSTTACFAGGTRSSFRQGDPEARAHFEPIGLRDRRLRYKDGCACCASTPVITEVIDADDDPVAPQMTQTDPIDEAWHRTDEKVRNFREARECDSSWDSEWINDSIPAFVPRAPLR